ncbi:hypothetical protein TURU_107917 [Turdus rufiventris]|nr:hypothetical protein TURU_107917 [Turdus rufiventris]
MWSFPSPSYASTKAPVVQGTSIIAQAFQMSTPLKNITLLEMFTNLLNCISCISAVFLESQNNIVGYGTIIYTTRFTESWHIGTDWESSFEYLIIWMCCEHTENNMNFKCMP